MVRSGYKDGPVATALLNYPQGAAVDRQGDFYFSDNNAVRKVSLKDGTVTTVAGGQKRYFRAPSIFPSDSDLKKMFAGGSSRDGQGIDAHFAGPGALSIDPTGRIWVAQRTLPAIRRITPDGTVTTVLGPDNSLCGLADFKDARPVVKAIALLDDGRLAFAAGDYVFVQKEGSSLDQRR